MQSAYAILLQNKLRGSGSRLTIPRKAILDVIATSDQPLTAMDIYEQARTIAPNLGLVTVYRTIDTLESLDLVDRIHGDEDCQTIFRAPAGHSHLLICTNCGKSVYFDGVLAEQEFDRIGEENGFKVTGHMLQLNGICQSCQEKTK